MSCLPPPQCLQSGDGAIPPEHMQAYKAETGPCLQSEYKIRSDAYASVFRMGSLSVPSEKTSPLYSPNPSPGCGQPAPPLAMLVALERRSQTRRERFFAPRNLSPTRPCRQPTLHRLGVRGSGTASMEGTFFSLGTDSGAMVLHCYSHVCCVEHGCRQELPMGATRSI